MAKILVVDDSAVDRRLAGSLLENRPRATDAERQSSLTVVYANDGKEGLAAIAREHPTLVLTDLQMPEMNGLELVEAVKRLYPTLPIILMTAHGSEDIAMLALEKGAASYVPKRKLASDLLETVEDVLSVAGSHIERQRLVEECWVQSETQLLLPNDLSHIPPLIGVLQENLSRIKVCPANDLLRVGVALREAMCNAMVHGNLEISSALREGNEKSYHELITQRRGQEPYRSRYVHVMAEESRREAVYVIKDEGPGFNADNLPDPNDPANLEKVSGRGLLLIRTFMDSVEFNARGNEITLVKRRSD